MEDNNSPKVKKLVFFITDDNCLIRSIQSSCDEKVEIFLGKYWKFVECSQVEC